MVRLITHNLLACHARGCTSNNFPLRFSDAQIETREADFNSDFIRAFMPKLEWSALVDAANQLGDTSLPLEAPDMLDEEFLKNLHRVLLEVKLFQPFTCINKLTGQEKIHIEEGAMTCPNCNHRYPISNGIPNMLLAEDEIA